MNPRWEATRDLLSRYAQVFRLAWQHREQLDPPQRQSHELAFLPANLELTETPVHPAPRWLLRILMATVVIVVLLAGFGRLDIVSVAPGKLVPNANVKVIQPATTGVVRSILVQDGQRVEAGQLLMELDPTQAAADADKAHVGKLDAMLAAARAQALLSAQQRGAGQGNRNAGAEGLDDIRVAQIPGIAADRQQEAQHFAQGAYNEYRAKLGSLTAGLHKRQAELATTREEIQKLTQTAPIARQQADDYKALVKGNYVGTHEYLAKEQTAIEQAQELAAQKSHAQELQAGIEEQQHDIDTITATFRKDQLDALDKAQQQLSQTRTEETKADAHQRLTLLNAPVAGTVQQLNVHTVGGVVTTAQALMEIVPDDTLEVDANVSNKDIGFVNVGQTAIVKVETFPYTRYGFLTGTVTKVSNDATQDKKQGLVFKATVKLPTNRMRVENKWINLTPGMQVTAEIKTGRQRVWEYFLSPLVQTAGESLRER
jgi:hemolysin D